ncbi:MAG: hypothetical protein JXQ73_05920 [Phycisphaerae bacterium]|nr:hypothetical protein [Phycisphaerae bacterium]
MRRIAYAFLTGLWLASAASAGPLENMERYLAQKDSSYQWRIIDERLVTPSIRMSEVILTSQTWRGMDWHHRVLIYRPKDMVDARQAFLLITGGDWNDEDAAQREAWLRQVHAAREAGLAPPPNPSSRRDIPAILAGPIAASLAESIQMPVAVLLNVPRQPIFDGKKEDAAISYTFEKYLETREPDWPLLLPMVKSAVRCLDALQEIAKQAWHTELDGFMVFGASKRGWTTWLTAAMDPRVKACAPMVIDVLNMGKQMEHQLACWGKYSEMISDYTMRGIQDQIDTPRGRELLRIVDPYTYQHRVAAPKMLILGTNDPYWPLDALNLYWDDLVGDKYISYIPNRGHAAVDGPRLFANLSAMSKLAGGKVRFPRMTWRLDAGKKGLTLAVTADRPAERMWAFVADSPTRDFRKSHWTHEEMIEADGGYASTLPMPASGYAATYGEGLFKLDGENRVYLCTNVKVIGPGPKTPKRVLDAAADAAGKAEALSTKTRKP